MARVASGARSKSRTAQDICADCGATEPGWASINRGILICDECCSVHRSLGRHMTHVKSLTKGVWHSSQLAMVHALNNSGANNIWEHTLLDPSSTKGPRRKPSSKDPVHPNKADFIRAKHQMFSFVYRPNREEGTSTDGDVSRQLHSSVRTSNLETSLRLLSLGADPNYYHPEKGNNPLHVAAKAGQSSQLELLAVYGADPGALDKDGQSPADYARTGGFHDLADRIVELHHEITDSLSFYLCGRKPDHTSGQHWIIPEMSDALDLTEAAKEARNKLVSLPNHLFEELVCDVYDEVDRRETDSIWLSLQNQSALLTDRCSVAFLPVNPEFSATRNQGRQKLARFNAREFATLIIDVLIETRRRMIGCASVVENLRDDEPLYDSVASEDDYSSWERKQKIQNQQEILTRQGQTKQALLDDDYQEVDLPESAIDSDLSDWMRPLKVESTDLFNKDANPFPAAVSIEEYLQMKKQLVASEVKIKNLLDSNEHMKAQLDQLSTAVLSLKEENDSLRTHSTKTPISRSDHHHPFQTTVGKTAPFYGSFPHNYETHVTSLQNGDCFPSTSRYEPPYSPGDHSGKQRPYSMIESRGSPSLCRSHLPPMNMNLSNSFSPLRPPSPELMSKEVTETGHTVTELPTQEEVILKTEVITKRIQELLSSAQDSRQKEFVPCAEQINAAVKEMSDLFPKTGCSPELSNAVRQLVMSAARLHSECRTHVASQLHTLDPEMVSQQVIQCAYDIAKSAKVLVTHFQ